jgi:hypothetical protein
LTGLADGELEDLIEEFSEGRVQFAYVKVIDPNSGLPKNVLIGWCGEGVPERTKGYFTSHLASVSKFLHVRRSGAPPRQLTAILTTSRFRVITSRLQLGRKAT